MANKSQCELFIKKYAALRNQLVNQFVASAI